MRPSKAPSFVVSLISLLVACSDGTPPQLRGFSGPTITQSADIVAPGYFVASGSYSPAAISGNSNNDYLAGDSAAIHVRSIRLNPSDVATITGLDVGQVDGREITLYNRSASVPVFLAYESVGSLVANHFSFADAATHVIPPKGSCELRYSGTDTRWTAVDTCGIRADCANGERLGWDTINGGWQCRKQTNDYRSTHIEWPMECLTGLGAGEYTNAVVGTGANASATIAGLTRPGVCDFQTGTTATGLARYTGGASSISINALAQVEFQWTGGVPTLSTVSDEYAVVLGVSDQFAQVNVSNGCFVIYDRGNVASGNYNPSHKSVFECGCANNNARSVYPMDGIAVSDGSFTTVNAPVTATTLPDTGIDTVDIIMTPLLVRFLINGVDSCHINSNIPSTAARTGGPIVMILKSAGLNSRDLYSDRWLTTVDLVAPRAP